MDGYQVPIQPKKNAHSESEVHEIMNMLEGDPPPHAPISTSSSSSSSSPSPSPSPSQNISMSYLSMILNQETPSVSLQSMTDDKASFEKETTDFQLVRHENENVEHSWEAYEDIDTTTNSHKRKRKEENRGDHPPSSSHKKKGAIKNETQSVSGNIVDSPQEMEESGEETPICKPGQEKIDVVSPPTAKPEQESQVIQDIKHLLTSSAVADATVEQIHEITSTNEKALVDKNGVSRLAVGSALPEDGKDFVDVSGFLTMPQAKAARLLGVPPSTLSKRWREAAPARKWPWRTVLRLDKEISMLLCNYPEGNPLPVEIAKRLGLLMKRKEFELRPVYIRM